MSYDTAGTDEIVCPWCGHEHEYIDDVYPVNASLEGETDCDACEKTFRYTMDPSVSWYTKRVEPTCESQS